MPESSELARQLAAELRQHEDKRGVCVVGVVPDSLRLAASVASILGLPCDLFPIQAIRGTEPWSPPVGVVGSGGVLVLDQDEVRAQAYPISALTEAALATARAIADFEQALRNGKEPPDLRASTVILVDDGRTSIRVLRMAIVALRRCWVKGVILAIPTITPEELDLVRTEADTIVSAVVPDNLDRCSRIDLPDQTSIDEIRHLLDTGVPVTSRHVRGASRQTNGHGDLVTRPLAATAPTAVTSDAAP